MSAQPGGPASTDPRALRSDAMSALLAENWWAVALRGVFAILFGLIALVLPGATIASLVLLFAAYMLVDGVFAIVGAVRAAQRHQRWGLLVLEGVADILTGVVAFLWPGITVVVFVLLMSAWALVSGGLMLGAAFRLNRHHGRWLLAFGGIVSIVWGILLFMAPVAGAVVLTWWLGAYALVFGIALLVLAFRLRGQRGGTASTGAMTSGSSMTSGPGVAGVSGVSDMPGSSAGTAPSSLSGTSPSGLSPSGPSPSGQPGSGRSV